MIKSMRIRWAGDVEGRKRSACIIFIRKPDGRPNRRLKDNIKMGLTVIEWEVVDRIRSVQDREQWRAHVNTVVKFRVA
jgi:hypothetical protein